MGCEDGFGCTVSEREMFINHTAATHTPSRAAVLQPCSVYHVWRKKVNKVTRRLGKRRRARGRERGREYLVLR